MLQVCDPLEWEWWALGACKQIELSWPVVIACIEHIIHKAVIISLSTTGNCSKKRNLFAFIYVIFSCYSFKWFNVKSMDGVNYF